MRRLKKRLIDWRNGNGEMLGFAICAPFLVMIIIAVMSFSRYAIMKEQLTVATYCVGRAAVVSATPENANSRAKAVLERIYESHVSSGPSDNPNDVWYDIDVKEYDDWKVGKIAIITLTQHMNAVFPLPDFDISRSLAMMIENQIIIPE